MNLPILRCECSQNLVSKAPSQNLPAMFVVKLLPFVRNLSGRKWSDDEIVEDVKYLKDELTAHFENLTCVFPITSCLGHECHSLPNLRTYDEYTSELTSGHLLWS